MNNNLTWYLRHDWKVSERSIKMRISHSQQSGRGALLFSRFVLFVFAE